MLEPLIARRLQVVAFDVDDVAYMGDDLADLPLLRRVGLPVAVPNAVEEVRQVARLVTKAPGGAGAVRELAETILRARGDWDAVVQGYLSDRGDPAPRHSRVR